MKVPPVLAARLLALGLCTIVTAASASGPNDAPASASPSEVPLSIPIHIRNHLPTTIVVVNGRRHSLFLDLAGAAALALTPDELSVTSVQDGPGRKVVQNAIGETTEGRRFTAKSVRVGGIELGPLVGDEWNIGAYGPPDRNGYLGMGFFTGRLVVMDYRAGRVRVFPGRDPARMLRECGKQIGFGVEVENGIAVSIVETELGLLRVLWDTGSTDNVIRSSLLAERGLTANPSEDGPPIFSFQRFAGLSRSLHPPKFRAVPFRAPAVDVVLGTPYFTENKVCLDLAAGRGAVKKY